MKADPLNPLVADPQVVPDPLDQFEKLTPEGGVVQVAVGVAGQVTVAPPPSVTVVCEYDKNGSSISDRNFRSFIF